VDSRHLHTVASLGEGLPPGHGIEVITVDQRAINIEQHSANGIGHRAPVPAPAGRKPAGRQSACSPLSGSSPISRAIAREVQQRAIAELRFKASLHGATVNVTIDDVIT
jgi:hypothetical protein